MQRISLLLRVPQPEGMTLPTKLQDPNGNAMYKSLLFRPFHAIPMDTSTGETPDPFLCLHNVPLRSVPSEGAEDDTQPPNPYMTCSSQWDRYWKEVVEPGAERARVKFKNRLEWESIWETKEVFVQLMELAGRGPDADTSFDLQATRNAACAHALVHDRVSVQ